MSKGAINSIGEAKFFGDTSIELSDSREELDATAMAEMMYQDFEKRISEIDLPQADDPDETVYAGRPSTQARQMIRQAGVGSKPASSLENAILSLIEVRDDMIKRYASAANDPSSGTMSTSIKKIEAQIISMGGEIDRFDPSKYQSGLKPLSKPSIDQEEASRQVVENTRQAYTLMPIDKIFSGKNKSGKFGVCVKIACNGRTAHGTVVPKAAFSGNEVIDYVPDDGKGQMSVKAANHGSWEDVSDNFDIAWVMEPQK